MWTCRDLHRYGTPGRAAKLLGIVGSWGDTLGDDEVLDMLTAWNTTGEIELKPIPPRH